MTFKIGDTVLCLTSTLSETPLLKKGSAYVINEVVPSGINKGLVGVEGVRGEVFHPSRFELAPQSAKKPHKHAELIKAWADGSEIQYRNNPNQDWRDWAMPYWSIHTYYRIKPEPKPDVVETCSISIAVAQGHQCPGKFDNLNTKFTFDGESGKLKAVQILS